MKSFRSVLLLGLLGAFSTESFSQQVWTSRNPGTNSSLNSVTWTGSQLVAVGGDFGVITSPNGINWTTRRKSTTIPDGGLFSVTWTGSQLVAVGYAGMLITSSDGISWTDRNLATAPWLNSITWTGSQLVTVGEKGAIFTSPDGITWTDRSLKISAHLQSVTWTGSQLVAVGRAGSIFTSPDGITWTPRSTGIIGMLYSVIWAGSQLVAVGDSSRPEPGHCTGPCQTIVGIIITSSDGITWTLRSSKTASPLTTVTWTGSQLVAMGNAFLAPYHNVTISSLDGINWIERNVSTSDTIKTFSSIIWTDTQLVAVGNPTTVLTSPQVLTNSIFLNTNPKNTISLRLSSCYLFAYLPSSLRGQMSRVAIYSVFGNKIFEVDEGEFGEKITIPITGIPDGQYLLNVKNSNQRVTRPFFLMR